MAKFIVCNKWELEIDDALLTETGTKGSARPYLQFVMDNIKEVAREAWCYNWLLDHIQTSCVISAMEYFGGIGMTATILGNRLAMDFHTVNDIDERSANHLLTSLSWLDNVYQADALHLATFPEEYPYDAYTAIDSDIVCLDFNSYTLHQWRTNKKLLHAMDSIMSRNPVYVILTDSACSRLHLNGKMYAQRYNHERSIETVHDYVHMSSRWYSNSYGYEVQAAAYHHGACYMLLGTDNVEVVPIAKAPPEADGFFREVQC